MTTETLTTSGTLVSGADEAAGAVGLADADGDAGAAGLADAVGEADGDAGAAGLADAAGEAGGDTLGVDGAQETAAIEMLAAITNLYSNELFMQIQFSQPNLVNSKDMTVHISPKN